MNCKTKTIKIKKISKLIICLMCLMLLSFFLLGCRPQEEIKLYYNGIHKTLGYNHKTPYECIKVSNSINVFGERDITFYPEDFHIMLNGKEISGQSFLYETLNKIEGWGDHYYYNTDIHFKYSLTIKEYANPTFYVYFGCSLENLNENLIFYKNEKLPPYSEYEQT